MNKILRKKGIKHTCKDCGIKFNEYLYFEADYEEWVNDVCVGCLTDFIEEQ